MYSGPGASLFETGPFLHAESVSNHKVWPVLILNSYYYSISTLRARPIVTDV